jgi:lipopolysaccharide biosynthesis glycosyltransferase
MAERSKSQKIHIALCFDDKYWALAYTVMRSVSIATGRKPDLNFHLLHNGLDPRHSADLDRIAEEFGAHLHFYDLNEVELFKSLGEKGRYHKRLTYIIYARLMLHEILPAEVGRVIYMDCDMYVRAPIEELFEMDLEGHAIAAVRDPFYFHIVGGRDLRAKRDLFDLSDSYFNSGLIVIDRDKWAEAGVLQRFEALIADGTIDRLYYDQDILNLIFCRNWKRLDTLWNVVKPRGLHEPLDPKLLHYTGPRKPWHLVSAVAFAREYRHVMTNELFYRYMRFRMKRRLGRLIGLK